jgi:hypothetical protein
MIPAPARVIRSLNFRAPRLHLKILRSSSSKTLSPPMIIPLAAKSVKREAQAMIHG